VISTRIIENYPFERRIVQGTGDSHSQGQTSTRVYTSASTTALNQLNQNITSSRSTLPPARAQPCEKTVSIEAYNRLLANFATATEE
jgi:hypothetical protein